MTGKTQPFQDDLQRILDAVRRRVKPRQFETWFARTSLLRMTPTEVVLGVPNQFLLEWMTREYQPTVDAAVREAVGRPIQIQFALDERAGVADAPEPTPGGDGQVAPMAPGDGRALPPTTPPPSTPAPRAAARGAR